MEPAKVFILTGEWFDVKGKNVLRYYGISNESGPVEILITNNKPVFFVDRSAELDGLNINHLRKEVNLKSFAGNEVDAVYFNSQKNLKKAAEVLREKDITTFESDVDPARRYLMERFINVQTEVSGKSIAKGNLLSFTNPLLKSADVQPRFKIASIDIETGVKSDTLYSIAVHIAGRGKEEKIVFMLGKSGKKLPKYVVSYESQKELLIAFIDWFAEADPDIIIGWHVIGFDLMYLERKCVELEVPFNIGRGKSGVVLKPRRSGNYFAFIPGRIVIDGPAALRSSFYSFEDYKLESVSQEILGEGKIITPEQNKIAEIERLFKNDKAQLANYNLQDAVLVSGIFQKTGLIDLSIKRAQLSGLFMDHLGMMSAAFDHFYLPRIHREGYVAPNVEDRAEGMHAAGGYVLDPEPGLYEDVVVLDFKSLYPTIIRTFKIDPLSRISSNIDTLTTPSRIKFSSTKHLLPDFIGTLMEQREEAKKKKDKYLSQAIKILMNSFYGVMGAYSCRFYNPELPSAITETGQWLLVQSKNFFEELGYQVVYGDTDSLFVKLKDGEGNEADKYGGRLAEKINKFWSKRLSEEFGTESYLEMEYEKYYKKFIITAARGSEAGAKKRYAGILMKNGHEKIEFVGMEFVRSDWTRLAKEFQVELYKRIFNGQDVKKWIRAYVKKINEGEHDSKLIYRKRLRKELTQYTKNVPPQVKAARMLGTASGVVQYIITKRGPVPVELDHSDVDYQHYIDKQIKPIADSVLTIFGESFDSIVNSEQLSIFD